MVVVKVVMVAAPDCAKAASFVVAVDNSKNPAAIVTIIIAFVTFFFKSFLAFALTVFRKVLGR
jgi:hypothetical protein